MAKERLGQLTARQREVLDLVRRGHTNREIATALDITEDGVKAHLSRLYLRYGVSNRIELLGAAAGFGDDRELTTSAPLGALRAIAGRADARAADLAAAMTRGGPLAAQLSALRESLSAVDGALVLVNDLPAETTGPVIAAVRKRLAAAFEALDAAMQAVDAKAV